MHKCLRKKIKGMPDAKRYIFERECKLKHPDRYREIPFKLTIIINHVLEAYQVKILAEKEVY
jgi:hypothetical protein